MGFAAPEIYKLGSSAYRNTYFHDVRCGFNGYPAGPGWDQASGFGSVDWYEYARGFASLPVPKRNPDFSACVQATNLKQLVDPFDAFIAWPVFSKGETSKTVTVASDDSGSNLMRPLHTVSYKAAGVTGSVLQTDTFDVQGDGSFSKTGRLYYRASLLHNNYQAAAMMLDVRNKFKAAKPSNSGTSCLYDNGLGPAFPDAPVDCYFYGIIKLKNGQAAFYDVFAEQNVVVEELATTSFANVPNGSTQQQTFADGISTILSSGIAQVNSVTNSGSGEKYIAARAGTRAGSGPAPGVGITARPYSQSDTHVRTGSPASK